MLSPKHIFLLLLSLVSLLAYSQEKATLFGKVSDEHGKALPLVNVSVFGIPSGAVTNNEGQYEIKVNANTDLTIVFSFIGYKTSTEKLRLKPGERRQMNRVLRSISTELGGLEVNDTKTTRGTNLIKINPKTATFIPSASGGGIEALVKTMPGVASNNELSSQYSVRGGNFDENLVYVNDIEIYRPFLVRSGQQEGLSFLNSDLVSSVLFSAGGFDARYGDKMSSALDIQYKRPTEFSGSVTMSLLGASAHIEGSADSNRLSYLVGVRQKSNSYLLNSLDTKGEYKPSFTDLQSYVVYSLSKKLDISFLGNYALNIYSVIPQDRETAFGTLTEAYQFKVYFEGQEKDRFENFMGALSLAWHPVSNLNLKLIGSAFNSSESETFDILGQYYLNRLETDWGNNSFGKPVEPIGVGSYLNHARNYLNATVYNIEQRGAWEKEKRFLQWGIKYQHEIIHDKLKEWNLIDSAGYTLPHPTDSAGYTIPGLQPYGPLLVQDYAYAKNDLSTNRYSGFVQNTWTSSSDSTRLSLTTGIRFSYWDLNQQLLVSPRISLSYKPRWKNDVVLRFATGVYQQPPFYRELRDFTGKLYPDQKAQRSYQVVAGSDWNFRAWNRPFKFVSEVYFKYLDNLIPYEIDNVRIRYYADQTAVGYATGIDFRVNGEFVKGAESWASLSVMSTRENIKGDYYIDESGNKVDPGYISRPTDQRVNFNLFFQDFLPKHPSYKMHLNLVFGSSLRFGPPNSERYQQTYKMPPYKRVDIDFSKQIKGEDTEVSPRSLLRHFKQIWISAEIFNLLQISNTVSYFWVSDISNRQYAIPNYLTPRQLNLKLYAQF